MVHHFTHKHCHCHSIMDTCVGPRDEVLELENVAQVPRAAEYFRRWVAKWPTVANLAAATEGEVNEMWAGLGYYR